MEDWYNLQLYIARLKNVTGDSDREKIERGDLLNRILNLAYGCKVSLTDVPAKLDDGYLERLIELSETTTDVSKACEASTSMMKHVLIVTKFQYHCLSAIENMAARLRVVDGGIPKYSESDTISTKAATSYTAVESRRKAWSTKLSLKLEALSFSLGGSSKLRTPSNSGYQRIP
jgi:hypothetical protein